MNPVFLDTVGLLALWDVSDQWHAAAEAAYKTLASNRVSFLTTTYVLLECGNAAARRPYRDEVNKLRQILEQRNELITPTVDDWTTALTEYSVVSHWSQGGKASQSLPSRYQFDQCQQND